MSSTFQSTIGTGAQSGPQQDEHAEVPQSLDAVITRCESFSPPSFIDTALGFRYDIPETGYRYWLSKCKDGAFPHRRDISPVELSAQLPNVGLFEVNRSAAAPLNLYCRIAGDSIEQVYGKMHRQFIRECLPIEQATRFDCYAAAVLLAGAPIRISGKVSHEERTFMDAEMMAAPLTTDDEDRLQIIVFAEYQPVS